MCLSGYFKGTSFDLFFKLDSARQPLLLDHDFSGILSFDSCRGSRLQAVSLLQAFNVTSFPSYKPSMLRVLPSLKAIACQFSHKETLQEKFCQLFEH